MRPSRPAAIVLGVALVFLSIASADEPEHGRARPIVIHAGDVEALYAAVGNPANANRRIVLEPGTYHLTALDARQLERPRGGSLFLQEGMALVGGNVYADADRDGVWDATLDADPVVAGATVIDGTGVAWFEDVGSDGESAADCAGMVTGYPSAAVINYRDGALVSRVSIVVSDGFKALAEGHGDYLPARGFDAEISDCFIDGPTFVALQFANAGCRMRNARSRITFERNIVRGSFVGLGLFNSLTNQASERQQGPTLRAELRHNHFLGNHTGVVSRNSEGSDGCVLSVQSTANLYEGNAFGAEATAGTDVGTPSGGQGNRHDFTSEHDTFRGNGTAVLAVGAWLNWSGPTANAHDETNLQLLDDRFEGGDALHAWPVFYAARPGLEVHNHISALVRGSSFGPGPVPRFMLVDTVAGDSNTVELVGGDRAFVRSNGTAPIHTPYLAPPNPSDLSGLALRFAPDPAGFAVSVAADGLDPRFGPALDYGSFPEFDDNTQEVALPFAFAYGGQSYASVWVNVDGNLTLGSGDGASTPRDVDRLLSGAPRIAPFLDDLTPYWEVPPDGAAVGSVHANLLADRAIFTWDALYAWADGSVNTFQATLFADGSIAFAYGDMGATDGIAGIARGGGAGPAITTDLSAASGDVAGATIYEEFFIAKGP